MVDCGGSIFMLTQSMSFRDPLFGNHQKLDIFLTITFFIVLVISAVYLLSQMIFLFVDRGTKGPNRFGEDPLRGL